MKPEKEKTDDFIPNPDTLQGFPGFRNRPNRSGLDPMDTRMEAAHMGGTFLQRIITLKARTHNPFYLLLMFIFGVIPFALLVLLIISSPILSTPANLFGLLYLLFFTLLTGVITINFILSLLEWARIIPSRERFKSKRGKNRLHSKARLK